MDTSLPPVVAPEAPAPPRAHSPFLPILVVIVLTAVGALFLTFKRTPRSLPTTPLTSPLPTLVSASENPFSEEALDEDNPFESVATDGGVYVNPFDSLEQSSPSQNPFETLR